MEANFRTVVTRIRQTVERAGSAATVEEALRWLLDFAADFLPGEVSAFLLLEEGGLAIRVRLARGLESAFVAGFERPVGHGVLANVVWSGQTHAVRYADPSSDTYKELRLDRAFGSGIAAPVSSGGRPFGYFWVQSEQKNAYDLEHLNTAGLVGTVAGEVLSHLEMRRECARLVPIEPETGLLRQLKLAERLSEEIERARRHGRPVSALMVHVQGLGKIRMKEGSAAAEETVKELARVARQNLRGIDLLGRAGPERVAACLPDTSPEEALKAGERLQKEIEELLKERRPESKLRVAVGVAAFPEDAEDARGLLMRLAEAALKASRGGVGPVVRFKGKG